MRKLARTVGAMLVNADRTVLLGLRSPAKKVWPCHWDIIGGHVEDGESLDAALVREVQEEVGVTPSQFRLIATFRERQPEIHEPALHHVYAVTSWLGGSPVNICDEHTELKWFSVCEMFQVENIAEAAYPLFARLAISGSDI